MSLGFDGLATYYRALEWVAFGRDLERARFAHLSRLAGCRDILLLGEGDGRCAERVAAIAPRARITCVDSSPGMIAKARARSAGRLDRISFVCADAKAFEAPPGAFDGVTTLFFLDCFQEAEVEAIVIRVGAWMRPGSPWLFADFALPERGYQRLRARAWLAVLYGFFRWQTGITAREIPPSEAIFARAGWTSRETRVYQVGLVRSVALAREPAATGAPAALP